MRTVLPPCPKNLKDLAKSCYPDYKGREFRVSFVDKLMIHDTNWSGGTRRYYTGVSFVNGRKAELNVPAPWLNTVEGREVVIAEGCGVITRCFFCGVDTGITIYLPKAAALETLGYTAG